MTGDPVINSDWLLLHDNVCGILRLLDNLCVYMSRWNSAPLGLCVPDEYFYCTNTIIIILIQESARSQNITEGTLGHF